MKRYIKIFASLFISFFLILIPWEKIKGVDFTDKINYFNYVYNLKNVLEYREFDSIISYISNEWLWHYLLLFFGEIMPYELFFMGISFFTLSTIIYFLIRKNNILSSLLLLNPLLIGMAMSQYRISLALSITLIAIYLKKYVKTWYILILVALLIHASVALFILIHFIIIYLSKINVRNNSLSVFTFIVSGAFISLMLSGLIFIILDYFGDRRSEYNTDAISSTFSYLAFWVFNLIVISYNSIKLGLKTYQEKLSIIILSIVSFNIIFGGYSTRILAVFLPVIISTNLKLHSQLKYLIIFTYIIYCIIQWVYWIQ